MGARLHTLDSENTISALMRSIMAADAKQKGCVVEFSPTINIRSSTQPQCYGTVTYGFNGSQRVFYTQTELFAILTRLAA